MRFLKLIAFQESRKVAFGLWLFAVSCGLLIKHFIVASDWSTCMILCASLVGGGTIADAWMTKKTEEKKGE